MFILSYWKGYTSLFIYVIYFKMDQTVCLLFPIGKGTQAYLFMLFISKWIKLSVYSFVLERQQICLLIYVIYFKINLSVPLFFPIGKEVH